MSCCHWYTSAHTHTQARLQVGQNPLSPLPQMYMHFENVSGASEMLFQGDYRLRTVNRIYWKEHFNLMITITFCRSANDLNTNLILSSLPRAVVLWSNKTWLFKLFVQLLSFIHPSKMLADLPDWKRWTFLFNYLNQTMLENYVSFHFLIHLRMGKLFNKKT